MFSKFLNELPSPLAQFAVVQVAIFATMGLIAWVSGFDFSMGLTMVGAIIFILRFMAASRRIVDPDEPRHAQAFLMTPTSIGLFLIMAGFILAFV